MAVSEVVKSGYLTKSPPEGAPVMSQWRKRWFVLCDSKLAYPLAPRQIRLEYYQSASDSKKLADPKGVIDLTGCTQVKNREPVKGHKFVFDLHTNDRVYHLAADNSSDKHDWIQTLNGLLFTPKNLTESRSVAALDIQNKRPQVRPFISMCDVAKQRPARPISFAGALPATAESPVSTSELSKTIGGANRPLPGVPGQERKHWPLPPPPSSLSTSTTAQESTGNSAIETDVDDPQGNYELASAPEDSMEPSPYEIPRQPNYEDIDVNEGSCQPKYEDIEITNEESPQPNYEDIEITNEGSLQPNYEDIEITNEGSLQANYEDIEITNEESPQPNYEDIEIKNDVLHSESPVPTYPSAYEVPAPLSSLSQRNEPSPPIPPPRRRRRRSYSTITPLGHADSLPDIKQEQKNDIESGDYGQLIPCDSRRFSQPDIIPLISVSKAPTSSSPLLVSPTSGSEISPISVRSKRYYENVGNCKSKPLPPPVPVPYQRRQDYSHLNRQF